MAARTIASVALAVARAVVTVSFFCNHCDIVNAGPFQGGQGVFEERARGLAAQEMPGGVSDSGSDFDVPVVPLPPLPRLSAPAYKPNSDIIKSYNSIALNKTTVVSSQTQSDEARYFYTWYRPDLGGLDYRTDMYSPGLYMRARRVYLCHLNPESWSAPRTVGVTWFEDQDHTRFKQCHYVAKDWQSGKLSIKSEADGSRWAVFGLPKKGNGEWPVVFQDAAKVVDSCSKRNCPLVIGNYGEDDSPIGVLPKRYMCRYLVQESDDLEFWVYGWSDARKEGNTTYDFSCIAFRLGKSGLPSWAEERKMNFEMMVYRDQDLTTKLLPAETACGDGCRSTRLFPYLDGFWPGMYDKDMTEGVFSVALDVASCCNICQKTWGCYGYTWYGRNLNWCWLKVDTCYMQDKIPNKPPSALPAQHCFAPPPADPKQCAPADGATSLTYSAVIPERYRATFNTGLTCRVQQWRDRHDLANCPTDLIVHAERLSDCCKACQMYNMMQPDKSKWCYAWTLYKVEQQCYLRKGKCSFEDGVPNRSTVSAVMFPEYLLPPNNG